MHAPPNMLNAAPLNGGMGDCGCGCKGSGACGGMGNLSQYFPNLNPIHLRYLAWGLGGLLIWRALR